MLVVRVVVVVVIVLSVCIENSEMGEPGRGCVGLGKRFGVVMVTMVMIYDSDK